MVYQGGIRIKFSLGRGAAGGLGISRISMCAGPDRIAAIRSESCHVVFDRYLSRLRRRMNSDCSPSWRTGFYGARDKGIEFLKNVYIMSQMRLICASFVSHV